MDERTEHVEAGLFSPEGDGGALTRLLAAQDLQPLVAKEDERYGLQACAT